MHVSRSRGFSLVILATPSKVDLVDNLVLRGQINCFTSLLYQTDCRPQQYGSTARQWDLPSRMPPGTDWLLLLVLGEALDCLKGSEECQLVAEKRADLALTMPSERRAAGLFL